MKSYIVCLSLLLLFGCRSSVVPVATEVQEAILLRPDPAQSFTTPDATQFDVCVLGEGWAIRLSVPGKRNQFPAGTLNVSRGVFHRGPQLEKYIKPSAGPVTPPLPENGEYSVCPLTNVTITVVNAVNAPEPKGYVVLTVSDFIAEGKIYRVPEPVRLRFRGPYP